MACTGLPVSNGIVAGGCIRYPQENAHIGGRDVTVTAGLWENRMPMLRPPGLTLPATPIGHLQINVATEGSPSPQVKLEDVYVADSKGKLAELTGVPQHSFRHVNGAPMPGGPITTVDSFQGAFVGPLKESEKYHAVVHLNVNGQSGTVETKPVEPQIAY